MGRRFLEATTGSLPGAGAEPGEEHAATRKELSGQAEEQDVPGRSRMNKQELAGAVSES